tara:strand:- start:242 stop:430 length:189 start_codon:yes stop_codon:yes gene_type:complete
VVEVPQHKNHHRMLVVVLVVEQMVMPEQAVHLPLDLVAEVHSLPEVPEELAVLKMVKTEQNS